MKNFKTLLLGLFAASIFTACNTDDITSETPPLVTNSETAEDALELEAKSKGFFQSLRALKEAKILLSSIKQDGGTPYNVFNPALRFTSDQNVFLPSVLGIDYRIDRSEVPAGPTARFPMFKGLETLPDGSKRESYYVITEASDKFMAKKLGVIFAPRMAASIGSGGEQRGYFTRRGRLVFEGSVDFSPKRSLVPGPTSDDGLLFGFPPAEVNPGAIADANWSSYVVLPSGVVINAQPVANSTGIHDRIPNPNGNGPQQEDDLNNPNFAPDQASVVMQLLDGWQNGKPYYFHIVTDTSDPGPATIELGVFAPRLAQLPTFGLFPGGSMLPFSPTANGRTTDTDGFGVQGLNSASLSDRQVQDPTNTFPIDPRDTRYAPMWDAHITEFTVAESERPILKSFEQINDLLADGTLIPFRGNANPSPLANSLSDLLTATGAIINCPVITQPSESVIGTQIGLPRNN
ncbi:hypothetical protein AWE51_23860 [Aquimarina aggregata]|uniref:Uncharacterized protein n=1 Tax=Aquimarina aggregata TaxID=1642818 RepID=A0A163B1T6_9FLAO|nr:hypothetical protein [Aquimarina aggregata]KZS40991.1 hypothetical protein AWE51_23860 [Aquimarina aggregata]